jgi:hypothetical protein
VDNFCFFVCFWKDLDLSLSRVFFCFCFLGGGVFVEGFAFSGFLYIFPAEEGRVLLSTFSPATVCVFEEENSTHNKKFAKEFHFCERSCE